jgi:mannose-6-phosphate isomerase-like protein (cupin superfamily)
MKVTDLHKYGTHAEMKRILTQPHRRTNSLQVAHNTTAYYSPESDCIHVLFHDTMIAVFYPDGSVLVSTGGHRTKTTKVRLNAFIPQQFTIYQDKDIWYVSQGRNYLTTGDREGALQEGREFVVFPYRDRMTFFQDGTVAHSETGRFDPFMYKGSTLWGHPVF